MKVEIGLFSVRSGFLCSLDKLRRVQQVPMWYPRLVFDQKNMKVEIGLFLYVSGFLFQFGKNAARASAHVVPTIRF